MTLMQKITLISLKLLSVIMLMLSCSTRMSFGYELNKNIVYYDGFIEGYLYKEIEDWSIICEVKNNDRCLLTQFLEIQIDESKQTFLIFIIKDFVMVVFKDFITFVVQDFIIQKIHTFSQKFIHFRRNSHIY